MTERPQTPARVCGTTVIGTCFVDRWARRRLIAKITAKTPGPGDIRDLRGDLKGRKMRSGVLMATTMGAALLFASSHASAQTQNSSRSRAPAVSLSEAQNAQGAASRPTPPARRGLRWYDTGRWGLNFNMSEPVGR